MMSSIISTEEPPWDDWLAVLNTYPMCAPPGQRTTVRAGRREMVSVDEYLKALDSRDRVTIPLESSLRIGALAATPMVLADELACVQALDDALAFEHFHVEPVVVITTYPVDVGVRVHPLMRLFECPGRPDLDVGYMSSGYIHWSVARAMCEAYEASGEDEWIHGPGSLWIEGLVVSGRVIGLEMSS